MRALVVRYAFVLLLFAGRTLADSEPPSSLPNDGTFANLMVWCDGVFALFVNGRTVVEGHDPREAHVFTVALQEGDVIGVRWSPTGGAGSSDGFLLAGQAPDGRVFYSGEGWYWTHNETASWTTTKQIVEGWHKADVLERGRYFGLLEALPGARIVDGKAAPTYLKAVVEWREPDSEISVSELVETWKELQDYFSAANIKPGKIEIWYGGKLLPLESLEQKDLFRARYALEQALEGDEGSRVPGGEAAIRGMLRGLQYAIGLNEDRKMASRWKVVCVLATNVDLTWTDSKGATQRFRSKLPSGPDDWRHWIEREMQRLSDILFEKSWGRINIVFDVRTSDAPITSARKRGERYEFTPERLAPAIGDALPRRSSDNALSIFVWIPKDGDGTFPPLIGTAFTYPPTGDDLPSRGKSVVVFCTNEERLKRPGAWASPDGAGALHEFWHTCEGEMKRVLGFKGFIPSNHSDEHFEMLKGEAQEQGLPCPENRYDAFFTVYPTWRMCRELDGRSRR